MARARARENCPVMFVLQRKPKIDKYTKWIKIDRPLTSFLSRREIHESKNKSVKTRLNKTSFPIKYSNIERHHFQESVGGTYTYYIISATFSRNSPAPNEILNV